MKKFFAILLCVLSSCVFAENAIQKKSEFSFSVEPFFGMKWGNLDELVYQKDSNGEYYKLSELNWQIKNMALLGANAGIGYKRLKGKLHFSALIPASSGIMKDSDWLDSSDTSMKTNFSKSENEIEQAFEISAQISLEFNPIYPLKIAPVFGIGYKTISFKARNGEGWYGNGISNERANGTIGNNVSWDDPNAIYYEPGKLFGLDYKREAKQIFAGFALEFEPIPIIRVCQTMLISPYTYTVSYDTHYTNQASTSGTDYADEVFFVFSRLKSATAVYYVLNERFEFGFEISAFYAFEQSGDSFQKSHSSKRYTNITNQSGAKGGAGAWEVEASLSCRIIIF